ncbi:hypothetical protein Mgra_00000159 [Meloidogyne graminicola]|uniref:Uncharacterized protein n=1 Tax=Meloidogyne graminicola TaxID=189291 RepID=A0A8T0A3C1_9BILA|nr:hypothetical protein Mgra_00000159 [Meloidogyne graminicola]
MPQNSKIPTSWKLLPVNVDFPMFDGKNSISKLNEEERQRNSELQELDEQQNPQNNERQDPKLIPLEYTGEIDDDSDENEMLESNNSENMAVENNRNYGDDCNINDSRFYLSSTSQLYKTLNFSSTIASWLFVLVFSVNHIRVSNLFSRDLVNHIFA